jgi:hypothetical protein
VGKWIEIGRFDFHFLRKQIKAENIACKLNLASISSEHYERVGKIARKVLKIQLDELGRAQRSQSMGNKGIKNTKRFYCLVKVATVSLILPLLFEALPPLH